MRFRRIGIKNYLEGGFLALAMILLAFSLSVGKFPGNTGREAERISRAIGKRMHILDKHISSALVAGQRTWAGHHDLPSDMVIYRYIDDTLQSWSNLFPVKDDNIASRIIIVTPLPWL